MKKLVSIFCALVILSMSVFSCFASAMPEGYMLTKENITSRLSGGFKTKTTTLYLPKEYLNQAENYLTANGNKLTADQYKEILDQINKAAEVIADSDISSFEDLKKDSTRFEEVKKAAQNAASLAGLKLTFGNGNAVTIVDENGNVVFQIADDGTVSGSASDYVAGETQTGNAQTGETQNNVIKTTGLGVNVNNAVVAFSVVGLLLLASGAVIYNNKLYKHE